MKQITKKQVVTLAVLTCGVLVFFLYGLWFPKPKDVCAQPTCSTIRLMSCRGGSSGCDPCFVLGPDYDTAGHIHIGYTEFRDIAICAN